MSQPWWHESPEDGSRDQAGVGTATQEAVKLAAAVSEWASRTGLSETIKGMAEQTADGVRAAAGLAASASRTAAGRNGADSEPVADPYPESGDFGSERPHAHFSTCDVCPVCQGMTILRSVSPEAAAGMAEALAAVTEIVKQTVDSLAQQPTARPRVEHIDIE